MHRNARQCTEVRCLGLEVHRSVRQCLEVHCSAWVWKCTEVSGSVSKCIAVSRLGSARKCMAVPESTRQCTEVTAINCDVRYTRSFSWATESRKRPPLPPPRGFASHKFVLALDRLCVTFARTSEPLVCLLGPSETHFFPTGGFFVGNRVPKATPTAPTARFCIAQVRTRVGSTFRDVCAHGRAVGVSMGSLRNSLFPYRRFFSWPESDPHCPHCTVLHRTSSYSRWINFS